MMVFGLDKTRRFHVHSVSGTGRGSRRDSFGEQSTSTSEVSITASRIEKRKREIRPNFFVGVKLDGIEEKVIDVQNKIRLDCEPTNVNKTLTSSKKMHLTGNPPPHGHLHRIPNFSFSSSPYLFLLLPYSLTCSCS